MTKDLCRETYAERSVGDRREAPGAHAESQQMSTGGTHERGVRNQRPNRVCREVSPEASCGRKSAQRSYWHSETEGIPTGSTHERGVRNQRRESAERGGLTDGILRWRSG